MTVLIVSSDNAERRRMSECLGYAGYATEQAGTGEAALTAASRGAVALVLLEVELEGICGYEVCHRLRDTVGAALPIILVSRVRTCAFDRVAGLLIGADDYLAEPVDEAELCARVRRLIHSGRHGRQVSGFDLTHREMDVLELLLDGLEKLEVAERLCLSPKTVGTHVEHIFRKLGVHTRAEAMALAYREDIIEHTRAAKSEAPAVMRTTASP